MLNNKKLELEKQVSRAKGKIELEMDKAKLKISELKGELK